MHCNVCLKMNADTLVCVALLCVFTFWVSSCNVCYTFRIQTMFGSSLPPVNVVCRRAHILFTLFMGVFFAYSGIVLFLFCFSLSCVPNILPVSLDYSFFYCSFGILSTMIVTSPQAHPSLPYGSYNTSISIFSWITYFN